MMIIGFFFLTMMMLIMMKSDLGSSCVGRKDHPINDVNDDECRKKNFDGEKYRNGNVISRNLVNAAQVISA